MYKASNLMIFYAGAAGMQFCVTSRRKKPSLLFAYLSMLDYANSSLRSNRRLAHFASRVNADRSTLAMLQKETL